MIKAASLKLLAMTMAVTMYGYGCSDSAKTIPQGNNDAVFSKDIPADLPGTSKLTLKALKRGNFKQIALLIHPEKGLLLSPYGHINLKTARRIHSSDFREEAESSEVHYWGSYDGTGDSILLDWDSYYRKFIYNKDYFNADSFLLNTIIPRGNTLNNIERVFPDAEFTESHIRGSQQHSGMDWGSLYLVFEIKNDKYYLVAIVSDRWTI